jgi:hypothetical protein
MKKLYFLTMTLGVLLSSCVNITEKIYIKEDGSGSYQVDLDMADLIEMMASMDENQGDSLQDTFSEQAKEKSEYGDIPGISNAKNSFDRSTNVYTTYYDFKSLSALNLSWKSNEASDETEEGNVANFLGRNDFKTISGAKKKFSIKLNLKELRANTNESDEDLEMAKMFMEENTYSIEFRFERKVKSFSGLFLERGEDDHTVIFSMPLAELLTGTDNEEIPITIKLK